MVTGELKGRLIVNYLRLLRPESKAAQSPCLFVQRAPTSASMAISPRNLLRPTQLWKSFWKVQCECGMWVWVFCNMSENFSQPQRRTDPQGLEAAALPCQIISWRGIMLCWRWIVNRSIWCICFSDKWVWCVFSFFLFIYKTFRQSLKLLQIYFKNPNPSFQPLNSGPLRLITAFSLGEFEFFG